MVPLPLKAESDPPLAKVLIVEDEVIVSIDLQTKLQSLGYDVPAVIRYGEQVEDAVLKEQPDLVLLDINLKGDMSGTEVGQTLSERHRLPIIFLTAFSDEKTVAEAKQASPYAFLQKPVNYDNLRLSIEISLYKAQMENRLKQSQERLELVIEGASLGTWDWEIETGKVQFNERWATMLGYQPDEIDPHVDSWSKLLHPEDTPPVMQALSEHLEGRAAFYSTEHRLLTKSGEWKWVLDSGRISKRDHNGKPLRMSGIHQDISERKQAEKALQQAHDQIREILNGIDANVYVATLDTLEILFMNQHMIEDFGKDLTGQSCWQALHQRSTPCPDCTNTKLTAIDDQSAEPYTWESDNDITGKTYLHHDRLIRWPDGRTVRLQIATDISMIRSMEEQLRQKYKMEAIGTMANGIAHNLNNNLAIVLGNLELAELKQNDAEKLRDYIGKSKAACFRSRDLIKQLATYSNKAHGQHQEGIFNLDDLVESSLLLITHSLPENIKLNWNRAIHSQPLQIKIDSAQLEEVLINLANNANTAMQDIENGVLDISTALAKAEQQEIPPHFDAVPGHFAVLSVQDNGCGIAQELIPQIFDPFFSTREIYEATGMGLSIVEGIMKQNQGFIKIASTPGLGSRFQLFFPLVSSSAESSS